MPLRTTARPPTAEELARLKGPPTGPLKALFGIALLMAIPTAFLFMALEHFVRPLAPLEMVGIWCGLTVLATIAAFAAERRVELPAVLDEWHVQASRIVSIEPVGSNGPALCFDLGEEGILLLKGQWLLDGEVYGAPPIDGDPPMESRVNGREDPYGFPCATFTLVRNPATHDVVSLRPLDGYVEPAEPKDDLHVPPKARWGDAELVPGRFDALQAALDALASAHRHGGRAGVKRPPAG